MTEYDEILRDQAEKVKKALFHLRYSFEKVQSLSFDVHTLSEEQLSDWESFVARFSRASDLFLSKYLRTYVLSQDPGFEGTFIDFLNRAVKLKLIKSMSEWRRIRDLRNKAAHEYDDDHLEAVFKEVRELTPTILELEKSLLS